MAEVWLDEYKEALYNSDREVYDKIDPDDLTKALEFKKSLNCKPFKYFLDVIAPDLAEMWPPFELPKFAFGAIYSEGNMSQCVTHVGPRDGDPLMLAPCISKNLTHPNETQNFDLTWHKFIKYHEWRAGVGARACVDLDYTINILPCHFDFGNQYSKYDLVRKLFIFLSSSIANFFIDLTSNH